MLDLEVEWRGRGKDEVGVLKGTGKIVVAIDPRYYRPTEVDFLLGNAGKARSFFTGNRKSGLRSW